ncbi:SVM family protein [Tenacibaculum sp. 1_MG-2023]
MTILKIVLLFFLGITFVINNTHHHRNDR